MALERWRKRRNPAQSGDFSSSMGKLARNDRGAEGLVSGFHAERAGNMKRVLLAAMLVVAMSAGALSARQLGKTSVTLLACGSSCNGTIMCARPCFCYNPFGTGGNCQPDGPPPPPPNLN
jgi:hypothetical protein